MTGVLKELELRREMPERGSVAGTLYFGGGTPSLLEPTQVARIIEAAAKHYALAADAEITLECNPGTVTSGTLAAFRAAGVNRLSLGFQSLDDEFLEILGRAHSSGEALAAFRAAREAGFDNIGIDLMHSLPGQDLTRWQRELSHVCELNPEHLSVYGLSIEEGTPFALLEEQGLLLLPDEEEAARMYEMTAELLAASGYEQYEIANFARPGFRSRHNSGYWLRRPYLGFGAGAHSFLRQPEAGQRFSNTVKVEDYLALLCHGRLPTVESRNLSRDEAMAECLFLGLRLMEGVSLERFREEFSRSFQEAFGKVCADLFTGGLLEIKDGFVRLTGKALILSNQVFVRFL